jgi:exodeoxyribonuclease VII large subunit
MLLDVAQFSLWGPETGRIWAVADLNRYVRQLLDSDYRLQDLWVGGEVSNLSRPASGHLYFTLKDAEASLRCVMWKTDVQRLLFLPRDGQAVEVHGRISVYEAGGQYQLYADDLRAAGEGALYQQFLHLKARLEAEGLFATERKRPIPVWPGRIGLVTSPTGAALRDVLNVLRRRFPLATLIISPTPVQGPEAPAGIIRALSALNQTSHPDVILLVRGGGSLEDLMAFNDEAVARAIAASASPVVTGVGHETDFTIADFVADLRAPTPSAAAELSTPDVADLRPPLLAAQRAMARSFTALLDRLRWSLADRRTALRLVSPLARVTNARQRVDEMVRRSAEAFRHGLALRRAGALGVGQALQAVDPLGILARGYAVVRRADDQSVVRSVRQIAAGDALDIRVADGAFPAEVRAGDERHRRSTLRGSGAD